MGLEARGNGNQSASLRDLGRAVREALSHPPGDGAPAASLDLSGLILDPPRMADCTLAEGTKLSDIAVSPPYEAGFHAFLDGAQRSTVADYDGPVPIVAGRTAAVIRVRINRRMTTWENGHLVQSRVYAPLRILSLPARDALGDTGIDIQDTLKPDAEISGHPIELLRHAVDAVQRDRESLERTLAESWAQSMDVPLFVDGGLPTGEHASVSSLCVGVIKSHHTIYAPGNSLPAVLGLAEGERSSAFVIQRTWGPATVSWYLRLHEPPSHDPFMGLVRVEVARTADLERTPSLTERADTVSQWILAERAPLAMPDERWDRMVYGIRDCEEYLRATTTG